MGNSDSLQIKRLEDQVKRLKEELLQQQMHLNAAYEVAKELGIKTANLETKYKQEQARNKLLENPHGKYHPGMPCISKVIYLLKRAGRPLRLVEIRAEMMAMDRDFVQKSDQAKYISVVLARAVKAKRLEYIRIQGLRGVYYNMI